MANPSVDGGYPKYLQIDDTTNYDRATCVVAIRDKFGHIWCPSSMRATGSSYYRPVMVKINAAEDTVSLKTEMTGIEAGIFENPIAHNIMCADACVDWDHSLIHCVGYYWDTSPTAYWVWYNTFDMSAETWGTAESITGGAPSDGIYVGSYDGPIQIKPASDSGTKDMYIAYYCKGFGTYPAAWSIVTKCRYYSGGWGWSSQKTVKDLQYGAYAPSLSKLYDPGHASDDRLGCAYIQGASGSTKQIYAILLYRSGSTLNHGSIGNTGGTDAQLDVYGKTGWKRAVAGEFGSFGFDDGNDYIISCEHESSPVRNSNVFSGAVGYPRATLLNDNATTVLLAVYDSATDTRIEISELDDYDDPVSGSYESLGAISGLNDGNWYIANSRQETPEWSSTKKHLADTGYWFVILRHGDVTGSGRTGPGAHFFALGTHAWHTAESEPEDVSVSDGVELGDTAAPNSNTIANRSAADGLDFGDTAAPQANQIVNRALSDGVEFGDSLALGWTLTGASSDGISLGDSLLGTQTTYGITITDGFEFGEAITRYIDIYKNLTDGVVCGDAISIQSVYGGALADGLDFSDSVTKIRHFHAKVPVADGLTFGDTILAQATFLGSIVDGIKFSDTTHAYAVFLASLTEGIVFGDDQTGTYTDIDVELTDGIQMGDAITCIAHFLASLTEGVILGDSVQSTHNRYIGIMRFKTKARMYQVNIRPKGYNFKTRARKFSL
jgi:hypothetical protein